MPICMIPKVANDSDEMASCGLHVINFENILATGKSLALFRNWKGSSSCCPGSTGHPH